MGDLDTCCISGDGTEKSYQTKEMNQLAKATSRVSDISEIERGVMENLYSFMSATYKDIVTVFDFIELTNKDNLQNRKDIESLAKIIRKNKNLAQDSTRVLIEMINKGEERRKFNEKQMQHFIVQFISTLKFTKRNYEDKAKDTTPE